MAKSRQNQGQRRAAKVKARKKKLAKVGRVEPEAIPLGPAERLERDLELLAERGEEFTDGGFLEFMAGHVQGAVADTVADPDPDLAADFSEVVDELDEVAMEEEGTEEPPGFGTAFALLNRVVEVAGERIGSQERIPAEVYGWLAEHFPAEIVDECRRSDAAVTSQDATGLDDGDDILGCMIWIAAGFAAVYGEGDIGWLAIDELVAEDGAGDGQA